MTQNSASSELSSTQAMASPAFGDSLTFPTQLLSLPTLQWFFTKGYIQGVFWMVMIGVVSATNDVLMRLLGERLPSMEIVFFRFLFGMLTVLPLMIYRGKTLFMTKRPGFHVLRAILGVGAILGCCYSVNLLHLSENTTIMFTEPLFFLPLAIIFLGEKLDVARWGATIIGFLGIVIIFRPGTEAFHFVALIPVSAAILFALLDIITKKMVPQENTLTMLFYFSFGTTLAALIPVCFFWTSPGLGELGLLFLLGIGANLIQVCLFLAFSATEASGLMIFRYSELIISTLFGLFIFREIPAIWTIMGALLIIVSTFYITYSETSKASLKDKESVS